METKKLIAILLDLAEKRKQELEDVGNQEVSITNCIEWIAADKITELEWKASRCENCR